MKSYSSPPISAREYPTVKILDNPYIWEVFSSASICPRSRILRSCRRVWPSTVASRFTALSPKNPV